MGVPRQKESHTWSRVPQLECKRSMFDRSHGYKTTFDEGLLIPFYADEVSPGDTHKLNATMFARLTTLKRPIMDNLYLETFFFFVPTRLLWDNHQRFWGEQDNPGDSTDFLVPVVELDGLANATGTIWDYLGIPVGVTDLDVSALWLRAYNLIWNEWFRDQNLQDSVVRNRGDGPDLPADYTLLRRGKRHDYFTSCLPFPQKGPEVLLPMAGKVPVVPADSGDTWFTDGIPKMDSLGTGVNLPFTYIAGGPPGTLGLVGTIPGVNQGPVWSDLQASADLGQAGGSATINDFRQAVVVQQFYEILARGGSRYVELLQSVFGVSNGDARLQRPEYLGGGRTNVHVNPVTNTTGVTIAGSGGGSLGELGAYGVGSGTQSDRHGFSKSFTEHGVLLGLVCVRADLNYQQGLHRMWSRRTKFDHLIPHFANLGEQVVYNREIFAQGDSVLNPSGDPVDGDVFGYVSRYDDYRYKPSQVTGLFRSNVTPPETSVDYWHLAQDFATLPTLSPEFIEEQPPIARVVALPEEPHFLLDAWLQLSSVRELPTYSVPGLRRI